MIYMLDTNICIYLIKQRPPQVLEHFQRYIIGEIGLSSITVAELQYGVQKSQQITRNQQALDKFLLPMIIADFDYNATIMYGKLRALLESQGQPIGSLDTLIAAHALSLNVTLVTNNLKEFERIQSLKLANWTQA